MANWRYKITGVGAALDETLPFADVKAAVAEALRNSRDYVIEPELNVIAGALEAAPTVNAFDDALDQRISDLVHQKWARFAKETP